MHKLRRYSCELRLDNCFIISQKDPRENAWRMLYRSSKNFFSALLGEFLDLSCTEMKFCPGLGWRGREGGFLCDYLVSELGILSLLLLSFLLIGRCMKNCFTSGRSVHLKILPANMMRISVIHCWHVMKARNIHSYTHDFRTGGSVFLDKPTNCWYSDCEELRSVQKIFPLRCPFRTHPVRKKFGKWKYSNTQ